MAAPLCCAAEDREGSSSPEVPNARISAATPANRPLLPGRIDSQNSRFTSARSEELLELRQIFDNAKDSSPKHASPIKTQLTRFARPSLHRLDRVKSVHALIKRKISRDLSKADSLSPLKSRSPNEKDKTADTDTVIKVPRDVPNSQVKITKEDLRKDLLSDKKAEDGGYDSDAQVMDDIARKVGRSPSKRPSIHSVNWTPSAGR